MNDNRINDESVNDEDMNENNGCDNGMENDYLTIKEFAELVDMPVESLRNYDREGTFHPAKRGKRHSNNYRYYALAQATTVKVVRVLKEIEVPTATIKELAKDRSPEKMLKLLSKYKGIVMDELQFLSEVSSVIGAFLELLNIGMSATEDEISVSILPERRILLGDVNDFTGSAGFHKPFTSFCKAPHEPNLNLSYSIGGYFESMDAFLNEPSRPTRFFSLDPKGHETIPAGLYLTGYNRGYYGQTGGLEKRMAAFAKKNGLVFTGPVYNIFLFDELSVTDPERYLMQAIASVKEMRRAPSRRLNRLSPSK